MDLDKNILIEIFTNTGTKHGVEFDDGRRWCAGCERPQVISQASPDRPWAEKTCPLCTAVWPEYAMAITQGLMEDEEFIDELLDNYQEMIIN